MAQFDLKNAIIYARDGDTRLGAINHANGYSIGDTIINIDAFVGAVAVGDRVQFAGDTAVYVITAHTEVLGNTTQIVISPALAAAAGDNIVVTFYQPNADLGAVDNTGGYPGGTTVLLMDSFIGIIATGDIVSIAGDTTVSHKVTAHVETLGNTTQITISPALGGAVIDTAVITVYQPNADLAAVNNSTGGYVAGTTTIIVDGFTGILTTGRSFRLAGDVSNTKYTITAHVETLGNTTSLTFTPAIPVASSVADDAVVTIGPNEIQVKLGTGNASYTEKVNRDYTLDRGRLSTVRNGDEVPVEVRVDAIWEFLLGDTDEPPSLEDVMKKRGNAANWVSSSDDPCEPYAIDLVIEYIPPCGDIDAEFITLPDFRYEEAQHDMKAGTLSFTGKCNVTEATIARVAA